MKSDIEKHNLNPQERFSDRVENYVKYRPAYPKELIEFIRDEFSISPTSTVVDVGSGTGIFTKQLLDLGCFVVAVEPNASMREAAESELFANKKFQSQNASAEKTDLPTGVADLITAAQAFHWFDVDAVRVEWKRILKSRGQVCLIWNDRDDQGSAFLREYDAMLKKFGTDYEQVRHRYGTENGNIDRLFAGVNYKAKTFTNSQSFDFVGLQGRLLSSSYAPQPGHKNHESMLNELLRIFDLYKKNGTVDFLYATKIYYGKPMTVALGRSFA